LTKAPILEFRTHNYVGPEGSGTLPMAIAYAQYILCGNQNGENNGANQSCNLKFQKISHPDLHFVHPTVTTEEVKKTQSIDFITDWTIHN
jgi:DNA polymerase-3 subunit delta'